MASEMTQREELSDNVHMGKQHYFVKIKWMLVKSRVVTEASTTVTWDQAQF